jgi:hypothetical protein
VSLVDTAIAERAPTPALPRIRLRPKAGFGGQEREREQTARVEGAAPTPWDEGNQP